MKMAIGATLYHCTNMEEEGMTDLEGATLYHCTNMEEEGMTDLEGATLYHCTNMEEEGMTDLEGATLYHCTNMKEEGMTDLEGVTLYHCTNMKEEGMTDLEAEEKQHQFCPKSEDSWCKWQADKITGLKTYKSKVSLPKCILYSNDQGKKTIFRDLSDNTLLTKCLHNFTRNQNESLNNVIWTKCPKNVFVGRDVLELSTSSAVINFNDGNQGLSKVLDNLGLKIGQIAIHGWIKLDQSRIRAMSEKHSKTGKLRRKKLRSSAKGWIDLEKEKEGNRIPQDIFNIFYVV